MKVKSSEADEQRFVSNLAEILASAWDERAMLSAVGAPAGAAIRRRLPGPYFEKSTRGASAPPGVCSSKY